MLDAVAAGGRGGADRSAGMDCCSRSPALCVGWRIRGRQRRVKRRKGPGQEAGRGVQQDVGKQRRQRQRETEAAVAAVGCGGGEGAEAVVVEMPGQRQGTEPEEQTDLRVLLRGMEK